MQIKQIFLIAIFFSAAIHADEQIEPNQTDKNTIILTSGLTEINIGNQISYFVDPDGKFRIEDMQIPDVQNKFLPTNAETPNFGFRTEVYYKKVSSGNYMKNVNLEIKQFLYK